MINCCRCHRIRMISSSSFLSESEILCLVRERCTLQILPFSLVELWCGGWDSNPRRPSPQGPKPTAGNDHACCPLDLALVPPRSSSSHKCGTSSDNKLRHSSTNH